MRDKLNLLILIVLVFWLLASCVSLKTEENYVNSTGKLDVEFEVRDKEKPTVNTRVYFKQRNSRQLRSGSQIAVNGVPLKGKAVDRYRPWGSFQVGYYYEGEIPKAEQYVLTFTRGAGELEEQYIAKTRQFNPHFPTELSLSKDLIIPFDGPPLTRREISIDYKIKMPAGYVTSVPVKYHTQGNKIIVEAASYPTYFKTYKDEKIWIEFFLSTYNNESYQKGGRYILIRQSGSVKVVD